MTPAEQIAEQFECSTLAAGEICTTAKTLAQCFVFIHDAYALDHVLIAKRTSRKLAGVPLRKTFAGGGREQQQAERAEQIRVVRRALPRAANDLFGYVQSAVEASDQFRTAVNIASCRNNPGLDGILSVALSALHEDGQLQTPEKVGDGRLAYESIRRDYSLLQSLGILKS